MSFLIGFRLTAYLFEHSYNQLFRTDILQVFLCHTVFTPKEGQLDEYLKAMLDHFFVTHDAIKQNLQQLGSAASESVNKERTKVKGFAAYKENSTPLSSVEEEKK